VGGQTAVVAPATRRLDSLTGLRWFAAFGVFCFHYAYMVSAGSKLSAALSLGYEGVPFFFVLSGFVLTWTYRPGDRPLQFYWRRFARVWPLMTACSLIVIATTFAWTHTLPSVAAVLSSVTLTQAWTTTQFYAINVTAWTLSCEAFFYLLFPLLIRLLWRRSPTVLIMVAIAMDLATLGTRLWIANHAYSEDVSRLVIASPLSLTPMFVVGMCTAVLIRRGYRPPVGARVSLLLTVGVAALCWWWSLHPTSFFGATPAIGLFDAVLVPFFALTIASVGLRDTRSERSLLAARWLVVLGEISFAFYLIHLFLLDVFRHYGWFTGPLGPGTVLLIAAALLITVAASWLLHFGIERPVERFLRGLLRAPRRRPDVVVAPLDSENLSGLGGSSAVRER
jgi:peptidoglycan/LPS O-acetylase OafA/YrhL